MFPGYGTTNCVNELANLVNKFSPEVLEWAVLLEATFAIESHSGQQKTIITGPSEIVRLQRFLMMA